MAGTKKILLVDDDRELLNLMKSYLEMDGFTIYLCHSGRDAIAFLKLNHVDIVCSDVRMPNGSGIELLEYISDHKGSVKEFYFMSGYAELTEEEALKLGSNGLFNKPGAINELLNVLKAEKICDG